MLIHELRRTQSPLDQTCIPIVFDQSLRKTCPPSHPPLATTSGLLFPPWIRGPSSITLPSSSTNIHFTTPISLPPTHPSTVPFVQLCCRAVPPTHILHVIVHTNSIFPCSIAHNTFYSMRSGGGSRSPYAKHHDRSSKRDNDTRRFVLHSTHMG